MLQAIRNRAHGILAWIMLIAIGVPFALWGIQNYMDTGKETPAAVVGDREIMDREVSRAYEQSLANLVGVVDYDEKALKRETLERLIRDEVVAQNAEKKLLAVSDADVRGFVQSLPYFQVDGKFDKEKYKTMLAAQGMSSDQFAAQIRRALVMEQFQRSIFDSAFVTKDQLEALRRLRNQQREIEYAIVPLKPSVRSFSDLEAEGYYKAHLADYRNPERVSIDYVMVSLEEIAKSISISDEELRNLYQEQKGSFGAAERRKLSHILIAADPAGPEGEKAALSKIEQIRERLVKGEDFGKLAKEHSGDPVSAKQGGNLGFIEKSNGKVKAAIDENLEKAAFELKPGELSNPVKSAFGYHLIKVTEVIPASVKPFEEVKDELKTTSQRNAAETKFYELGQKLIELSFQHPDSLAFPAKELNLKVEQSGLFTRDAGEGIAAEDAVRKAAFSEDVLNGRNSDPVELGSEKALVLRVREHQTASDKPLAEVKDAIVAKLRADDARRETMDRADELMKQVRDGKAFADAVKAMGLTANKPALVRRDDEKIPAAVLTAAFSAPRPPDQKPHLQSVALETGDQAVLRLTSVKDGEVKTEEQKDQDSTRALLAKNEGQREFAAFIARLRELAAVEVKPES